MHDYLSIFGVIDFTRKKSLNYFHACKLQLISRKLSEIIVEFLKVALHFHTKKMNDFILDVLI